MAKLNVNGKVVEVSASEDTPLLWVIREQLGLTGTKYGCGIAQCGSCMVHLDGEAFSRNVEYAQLLNDASEVMIHSGGIANRIGNVKPSLQLRLPLSKPDVAVPVVELFLRD